MTGSQHLRGVVCRKHLYAGPVHGLLVAHTSRNYQMVHLTCQEVNTKQLLAFLVQDMA